MRTKIGLIAAIVACVLCACTTEQAYRSGQSWQQNQCSRLPDKAELDRCMAQASVPYDAYKKEAGGAPR